MIDLRSLPAQMISSFIILVLLTAAAAGLPAIWLINNQLERQAWAQVEQGSRAVQALYVAHQNELVNLATLSAERPTLHDLLAQGEEAPLQNYLRDLQEGAGLDLVLVCDVKHQSIAQVGADVIDLDSLCKEGVSTEFHVIKSKDNPQVWLFAVHPITGRTGSEAEKVIVGVNLDDDFAVQMRRQSGLEHTLLVNEQPVASSLNGALDSRYVIRSNTVESNNDAIQTAYTLDGRPFYALRAPLPLSPTQHQSDTSLEAEAALAVEDLTATRWGLIWTLTGSIFVVAAVGSVLGILLARQIARPLAQMAEAATALSQGNLDSSMLIEARVREVALVAQALENARIDLRQTLSELRQEKAWTDHLLEAIVEGIVTLDHQGRITFFSPGAERITGWKREEVLHHPCDKVFQPIETDRPFSQLLPPPDRRHKISVALADGSQATLSVTSAPLIPPETGDARVALVFRDVSEEEMIHRLMGNFLANISHEFRTPLSSLAASAELLLDQAPLLSQDELQELLTSLHLGIVNLQRFVDNLVESASIEAGRFKVHIRPANLSEIIAKAIQLMQPLLDKHDQKFALDLPEPSPIVLADWRRTVQALVNLLANAVKYGPDNAEISLSAVVEDDWVRISVADRGPGVLLKHRSDLFRRFVHHEAKDNKSQYGVGLGLSVVKAVVEAQDGQVGIEDRPGGGLVFWFTLPIEDK